MLLGVRHRPWLSAGGADERDGMEVSCITACTTCTTCSTVHPQPTVLHRSTALPRMKLPFAPPDFSRSPDPAGLRHVEE